MLYFDFSSVTYDPKMHFSQILFLSTEHPGGGGGGGGGGII